MTSSIARMNCFLHGIEDFRIERGDTLSEPKVVFLTDGPTRHVRLGKRTITLKRTTPKNMATAGRKSGTLIQALRHLGQTHVDDKVIGTLRRQLTAADRAIIRKDLRYAPAWIADILRKLSESIP